MAPMDEHGLSEDSLRGSEHFAVRAPAPVPDVDFEPLSVNEKAAADRFFRTSPATVATVQPVDRLPVAKGAASASHIPVDPTAQVGPESPAAIPTNDPGDATVEAPVERPTAPPQAPADAPRPDERPAPLAPAPDERPAPVGPAPDERPVMRADDPNLRG
jgi:hypothetical protein